MSIILLSLLAILKPNHLFNKSELVPFSKMKRSLSLNRPQWYYVHYLSSNDINSIKKHLPNVKITSFSFCEDYLTLFLTQKEAEELNSLDNIQVYYLKKKSNLESLTKSSTFLVQADSSFQIPKNSKILSKKEPFYLIETKELNSIESDPTVFSVTKIPLLQIMNRWTTGFLQSGEEQLYTKNGYYTSNRKYNDRNLTGNNVIVTLIDTGADMNNCLFRDPNVQTPFNKTNLNHRKVVRYDPFVDSTDRYAGHGTHCAGIIAGSTDEDEKVSLYNGHAPNAKLYVADIGKDEVDSINVDLSSLFDIVEASKKLESPIISCSWGINVSVPELSTLIDYLAFSQPFQLFVFAAGNDGTQYAVGSPADSKNVLTVAASYPTRPFFNSYYPLNWIKIEKGDQIVNATSFNSNLVFEERKEPSLFLRNVEVVTFDDDSSSKYSGKVVVIPDTVSKNLTDVFDFLQKKEAKAAVVFNKNATHDELFVLSVPSEKSSFLIGSSKVIVNISIDTIRDFDKVTHAPFSSIGPAYLGNRKPDVMAPGFYISSAGGSPFPDECDTTTSIIQMSGTSMAAPAVSGSIALIYEYLSERKHLLPPSKGTNNITSPLLRAFAIASSGDKSDNLQGYGNINLSRILIYPELDSGFGLRFQADEIRFDESVSFTVKTNSIGDLSVSLAWADIPLNSKSTVPLFAYLDLYIVGPNGELYDSPEDYSTTKKIVIKNAPSGKYEIRIQSNMLQRIKEENVYYGLVLIGSFDHLDFESNPSELKAFSTQECSPSCPSNCDSSSHRCICPNDRTGTHCESVIDEVSESTKHDKNMKNREFWFMKFDIRKHHSISKKDLQTAAINIECKVKGRNRGDEGMIRYYLNVDNRLRLSIPRYSIALQEEAVASFQVPLIDIIELDYIYFTAFNDLYANISLSVQWDVVDTRNIVSKFVDSKIFRILMIILIVVFSLTIVGSITAIIVCIVLKRKRKHRKHKKNGDELSFPDPADEMKDALINNNDEII